MGEEGGERGVLEWIFAGVLFVVVVVVVVLFNLFNLF